MTLFFLDFVYVPVLTYHVCILTYCIQGYDTVIDIGTCTAT